ncbi:hypothetical protein DYB25_000141 [Aphanomyces astaci]|nr:hypothetical protein DYB36_000442 [Aphanomyces astaci]RHY17978.1 hypothetical protein DYB25_000141 [Aphanomyces astaci]RHY35628.1 hypothetical protein DYB38_000676 [Aphanomyces astaci]RHY57302.1 hypothetical protein DYB34_004386 [Aphanomyces astaci]RHY87241.1 hypothetical protein DYB31_000445 [Aphanomyces astaci]
MHINNLSFLMLVLAVLASLLHTSSARHMAAITMTTLHPENATMPAAHRYQDDIVAVSCSPVEATMTPLCGDHDNRQYHAYVCEKQCIDAVKHLLRTRRQDEQKAPHALCLAEWKSIGRVQATECPTELQSFLPASALSVSTIASAILSVFVLFSCN